MRRLCDKACAVVKVDALALVSLLRLDERRPGAPSAVAASYAAAFRVARDARAWLGFAPVKRGYAVSLSANGANSLAAKYEHLLRDGFAACDAALDALDGLRCRLPVPSRVVRFARPNADQKGGAAGEAEDDDDVLDDAPQNRRTSFPRSQRTFSVVADDADDDSGFKFAPDRCDDFLTDAAPLGHGIDDGALFACCDGAAVFFTSNARVAETCDYAGKDGDDDDDRRPRVIARTILYQKLDGARDIAMADDEIWSTTIDGRAYFNVVMADDSDRGLRHVLNAGGVDDAALAAIGVAFARVE